MQVHVNLKAVEVMLYIAAVKRKYFNIHLFSTTKKKLLFMPFKLCKCLIKNRP